MNAISSATPRPPAAGKASAERPWLESIVSCVPHGLALIDAAGLVVWSNRELADILGQTRGLKGTSMGDLVEDWVGILASLSMVLAHEPRMTCAVILRTRDAERMPAVLTAARCAPGVAAAWSLHVEVTQELEVVRRQLSDRERSYSFLRANISDMIVRTDSGFGVTWRNESASAYFPVGTALADLVSVASLGRLTAMAAAASCDERRVDIEIESRPNSRPMFFLKGTARRLVDDAGEFAGIAMIVRDHSENRRLAMLSARLSMTPREEEIIDYLLQGYSNLNIATILGLSESGVKFHIRNVFGRAQVSTRTELMAMVMNQ